jgi:D-ribose pyranase
MKRGILLNSEISYVISKLGHTDTLTIGDCGLPVPEGVQRIDLAVVKGLPGFIPVLEAVLDEQEIEQIILAKEIEEYNPTLLEEILQVIKRVSDKEKKVIRIEYVTHEEFKKLTRDSKAVIRTGEFRSYANIILVSSVTF